MRDVITDANQVEVCLALPEPQCPFMEYFVQQSQRKVEGLNGIERVEVTFLDEPLSAEKPAVSALKEE